MEEGSNSTGKVIFWAYFFVSSYPAYRFIAKQIAEGGADKNGLAVGILLIGIDLAVLWWLWLMAYSQDIKRKLTKKR
jgi:hypothetical protein